MARVKFSPLMLPLAFVALQAHAAETPVRVTSSGLNVRTADGKILCTIAKDSKLVAIGRKVDGEWLKVKVSSPSCPKEGYVAAGYVKPENNSQFEVDTDALSFRSSPMLSERNYNCSLPRGTKMKTISDSVFRSETRWVKVELINPKPTCPKTGWVAQPFLKSTHGFTDLPTFRDGDGTDIVADCNGAGCNRQPNPPVDQMNDVSRQLGRQIQDQDERSSPFVDGLRAMIKNPNAKPPGMRVNRGLAQIPLLGNRGNIGPCGSHHYNPDQPPGTDVYTNPLTACVFTSVLQQWRKTACPDRAGCTIAFGDISHRTNAQFNGHRTHTNGHCIDIRPMRKGGFEDAPLNIGNPARPNGKYDRAMMQKFVNLLKANGADTGRMLFNDTRLGTRYAGGHSDHIHVCFTPNAKTRQVCNNLKVDPNLCPELQ